MVSHTFKVFGERVGKEIDLFFINTHSKIFHNHTTVDPEVLGIYPKSINGDVYEVTSIANYYRQPK